MYFVCDIALMDSSMRSRKCSCLLIGSQTSLIVSAFFQIVFFFFVFSCVTSSKLASLIKSSIDSKISVHLHRPQIPETCSRGLLENSTSLLVVCFVQSFACSRVTQFKCSNVVHIVDSISSILFLFFAPFFCCSFSLIAID
jgi:hypothetical protein